MKKHLVAFIAILVLSAVSLIYALPVGWRNEVKITTNPVLQYREGCVTTDYVGRIHVAVRQANDGQRCCDLNYYHSLNTGLTWTEILTGAPFSSGTGSYCRTDIAASGDNIMIIYQKPDGILFMRSTNGGSNWDSSTVVDSNTFARNPRLALEDTIIHAFYSNIADGNLEVFCRQSVNSGNNWSSSQRLTNAIRNSWHPAVSVNAGVIHLVWADNRDPLDPDNYEIYYNRSIDHGQTWVYDTSSGFRFTRVAGASEFPDIVAYSDQDHPAVHVV